MYITKTHNGNKRTVKIPEYINFEDYGKFKKRICAVFGPINEKLMAENIIQRL